MSDAYAFVPIFMLKRVSTTDESESENELFILVRQRKVLLVYFVSHEVRVVESFDSNSFSVDSLLKETKKSFESPTFQWYPNDIRMVSEWRPNSIRTTSKWRSNGGQRREQLMKWDLTWWDSMWWDGLTCSIWICLEWYLLCALATWALWWFSDNDFYRLL